MHGGFAEIKVPRVQDVGRRLKVAQSVPKVYIEAGLIESPCLAREKLDQPSNEFSIRLT
jgi:hypothetical protein